MIQQGKIHTYCCITSICLQLFNILTSIKMLLMLSLLIKLKLMCAMFGEGDFYFLASTVCAFEIKIFQFNFNFFFIIDCKYLVNIHLSSAKKIYCGRE